MKFLSYKPVQPGVVDLIVDWLDDKRTPLGRGKDKQWLLIWDNVDDLAMMDELLEGKISSGEFANP